MHPVERGGKTVLDNLILLCHRHHKHLHDNHIHAAGDRRAPHLQERRRTRDRRATSHTHHPDRPVGTP